MHEDLWFPVAAELTRTKEQPIFSWSTPPSARSAHALTWAVISAALGLRLWHAAWGLPDFLEEAIPLHVALQMTDATGKTDWNPHFFHYPSLAIYLHFFVQHAVFTVGRLLGIYHSFADYLLAFNVDPTPMVIAARLTSTAFDVLSVLGIIRLGNRLRPGAGWIAGLLVAFAAPMITAGRSVFTDTLMVTCAVWSLERAFAWLALGGRRRLVSAAILCGLAASAKYPGAFLLIPVSLLIVKRESRRAPGLVALSAGIALCAFLATSPYALLDPAAFARDFRFEGAHASTGHLGGIGHSSFGFFASLLVRALGPVAFVLFLGSAALLSLRAWRWTAGALWATVLAFGIPISLAQIPADRYLLPVLVVAALLAALAALEAFSRIRAARPVAIPGLASAILLPALASGFTVAATGARETQALARRWCEAHVPDSALVVQEGYGIPLPSESQKQALLASAASRLASPDARARLARIRAFNVVSLPLQVAGACTVSVPDRDGRAVAIEVFPHASDLNQLFYDPRLFAEADLFVTSSSVRSRYQADPQRYAAQLRFYQLLDRHATRLVRFTPDWSTTGPELNVYRIDPRTRLALADRGPLPPSWWTVPIPSACRERILELRDAGSVPASHAPEPDAWVDVLSGIYARHVYPFAEEYAIALLRSHATATAAALFDGSIAMLPGEEEPALMRSALDANRGDWAGVRRVLESAAAKPEPSTIVLFQYGRALAHLEETARAREVLMEVIRREPGSSPIAAAAQQAMATLPGRSPRSR